MDPLIERRVGGRALVCRAQPADVRRPVARQLAQLLDEAGVEGEGGVDPAERVDGLGLDAGARVEDAVDGVAEVLLGGGEHGERGQQQHGHLGLEDRLHTTLALQHAHCALCICLHPACGSGSGKVAVSATPNFEVCDM